MEKVAGLYLCPWSLNDPLCQSQSLAYLNGLVGNGLRFALITFESPKFRLNAEQTEKTKKELAARGIFWYPAEWSLGASLPRKALGGAGVLRSAMEAVRKHQPQVVHSRSSSPAVFAVVIAKLFRLKFLYDADSILSQEYVDVGHWSPDSVNFKILVGVESLARKNAAEVIVLTETLKRDFAEKFGVKKKITVIPCCVDAADFAPRPEMREARRRQLNLRDEKLLVYVGKIGARYQVDKIFEFYETAQSLFNAKLLIVSMDSPGEFHKIAEKNKIERQSYFVVSATKSEVKEWLSAADAGIAFIKESESERGSSPIKISEYLANGLPVLISDNIGDISSLIEREKLGAVVKNHAREDYRRAASELENLWNDDDVSKRCREIAFRTFDLETLGGRKYLSVYKRLLEKR